MAKVYVAVSSNLERDRHIRIAVEKLGRVYGELEVSTVYESEAIEPSAAPFYTVVIGFTTYLEVRDLVVVLRKLERSFARRLYEPKHNNHRLLIDLLTYGDWVGMVNGVELPRRDIMEYAHILCPLAEIAPTVLHPKNGRIYTLLWEQYDKYKEPILPLSFKWGNLSSSKAIS